MNYEIDLDITPGGVPKIVKLSQYDKTMPVIVATLWNGSEAFNVPSGASVYVAGTKADNTGFEYQVTYSDNVVTIPVSDQMTVFAGRVATEVIIRVSGQRKGSANFFLDVEPAALKDDVEISETDIPIIEQIPEILEDCEEFATLSESYAKGGTGTRTGEDTDNAKYYCEQARQTDIGELVKYETSQDKTPYLFRQSTHNAVYDKLVGLSVVKNQLRSNVSVGTTSSNGIDYTISSDGSLTVNGTATANSNFVYNDFTEKTIPIDHKLLLIPSKTDSNGLLYTEICFKDEDNTMFSDTFFKEARVFRISRTATKVYINNRIYSGSSISNYKTNQPNVIDLTAMFGNPAIADLIYTMEQATAGSGIAYLKSLGLLTDGYEAYNVGEIVSSQPVKRVVYDENGNAKVEYDLGSDTLRGIPTLDGNNIVADGDVKTSDGVIARKILDPVNLGTQTWTYDSSLGVFIATISGKKAGVTNCFTSKYPNGGNVTLGNLADKTCRGDNGSGTIYIKDSSYSDATTFKAAMDGVYVICEKSTPTTEVSTPFTSPQVSMVTEEIVSDVPCGHDSTVVDISDYYKNEFWQDVLAKATKVDGIERALPSKVEESNIAPVENGSTASTSYSVGALIMRNGTLYKVKSSIASGGTFTVDTNIEKTTLAEVIASL